jgi:hypothetical protein
VDALDADDLAQARELMPATKLAQALDMMQAGIRLKRASLRQQDPTADETEIERRLTDWLSRDD